ncbi:MAG: MBL fold metallo-hydrolase [Actinomycetia bacterium]|nr:MBL fold metallo-hydrolase [Actinomycetes bacterium]
MAVKVTGMVCGQLGADAKFFLQGGEGRLNPRLVVQQTEWDTAHDAEGIAPNGYNPADFDHDMDLEVVDGEHDLFGDGSVRLIPTFGHTPGHQSMVIEVDDRHLVLTGDACYFRRTIDELNLPRFIADPDAMVRSLHQLRALEEAGMELIFGHDESQWDVDARPTVLGQL